MNRDGPIPANVATHLSEYLNTQHADHSGMLEPKNPACFHRFTSPLKPPSVS